MAKEKTEEQGQAGRDDGPFSSITGLINLDFAAMEAYDIAIKVCTIPEIIKPLQGFRADHERHVRELSEWVESHGAGPVQAGADDKGLMIKGYTLLSSQEDRGALLAMRGNEELTNSAYASVLRGNLPDDLRGLVESNFQDERRHIAWIRQRIELHGWDKEPPELRELVASISKAA
jgi:competence protein ComEA